jgi:hypothetical protein
MTIEEQYVIALVLASLSKTEAEQDAYTDISVSLGLGTDWTFEQRQQLRNAATWVLNTLHPEVRIDEAVAMAIAEI